MPFAYILKSSKDRKFFYGSTSNLETRLKDHNNGKVRSTKRRRPLILHYSERCDNIKDARKRVNFFKSMKGFIWLKKQGII
jgi:putative endonuclease